MHKIELTQDDLLEHLLRGRRPAYFEPGLRISYLYAADIANLEQVTLWLQGHGFKPHTTENGICIATVAA